jgi:hypothetical protein
MSFVEKLDKESLAAFNDASAKPFASQAVFFLNAFWDEFGDQAEFIYSVAYATMRKADMEAKGISYVHLYDEGFDLDFDMGLYFFEQLVKFCEDPKNPSWRADYPKSMPVMMTSIVRKKELRDKVDVNFDGRVGFLEYLLYQYNASPKDLMDRSMGQPVDDDVDEAIRKAREALEQVNRSIQAYEAEKQRLTDQAEGGKGIKALKAKNELAQLESGPLWEKLNKDLITAEAAVRIATREAQARGGKVGAAGAGEGKNQGPPRIQGAMWWMQRDLEEKKKKYGRPNQR